MSSISSKGSDRYKKSWKSKRNSHGSGSHENLNKKRITESSNPPVSHSGPHLVSGNAVGGVGTPSSMFHSDTNTLLPRLSLLGNTAPPLNIPQDDFLVKPIDTVKTQRITDLTNSTTHPYLHHFLKNLNMIKLSSHKLIGLETRVLARGLSFCRNQDLDKFKVIKGLQLFARNFILKQMYSKDIPNKPKFKSQEHKALDTPIDLLEENDPLDLIDRINLEHLLRRFDQSEPPVPIAQMCKKKSDNVTPLSTNSNVLAFVKLTGSEIHKINTSRTSQDNLSKAEREALKSLADNSTITIKPSDKGGNVVIMNKENFVDMCNKILNNKI